MMTVLQTTFLTTLAGRASYGTQEGHIMINGVEDSLLKYPKLVGFVPQEDVMHRDCTVEEVEERISSQFRGGMERSVR